MRKWPEALEKQRKGEKGHLQKMATRIERRGLFENNLRQDPQDLVVLAITEFDSLLCTDDDIEAERHCSFKANVVFHRIFRLPIAGNWGIPTERSMCVKTQKEMRLWEVVSSP